MPDSLRAAEHRGRAKTVGRRFCFTFGTVDGSCPFHPHGIKEIFEVVALLTYDHRDCDPPWLSYCSALTCRGPFLRTTADRPAPEVAFHILHPYGKARTRATKKDRLSVSSEPTEVTAKTATVDELAGPVAQLMLDPPKSPEVVYAPTRPTNWGQDTAPDSGSDDRTSNSSGSVGRQHKAGMQRPTLASIIMGAARNIPWGDHDHDHDDH